MTFARPMLCLFTVFAAAALTACGPSFSYATPHGFVELEPRDPYDYRAVTADGLVLAAREIDHDPKGDLAFWTEVITNHLRQRGGYALLATKPIKTAEGLAGAQLRFGHDEGSRPYLYYVTVLVTDDTIYVLEAGGTKAQVEAHAADIASATHNFRTD
ncbi:MAG TPA: hypothetical protein VFG83_17120 [Kofleriaceae bacterium]|nr:hypothetical protein [Kofleriaceae bacterium]